MSKKPRAKRADALNQMGSLIFMLTRVYPKQAERYQKAKRDEQRWGEVPAGDPLFSFASERLAEASRHAEIWREVCQQAREQIPILAQLVASHFPEVYRDLEAVRFNTDMWHDKPVDEWQTLFTELADIESAALRAAPSLHATKPSKRRGRREIPLDEIRDKLDEVERIGISSYCQREGIDPSTISRWRTRLKKP